MWRNDLTTRNFRKFPPPIQYCLPRNGLVGESESFGRDEILESAKKLLEVSKFSPPPPFSQLGSSTASKVSCSPLNLWCELHFLRWAITSYFELAAKRRESMVCLIVRRRKPNLSPFLRCRSAFEWGKAQNSISPPCKQTCVSNWGGFYIFFHNLWIPRIESFSIFQLKMGCALRKQRDQDFKVGRTRKHTN